jgi:hypothetical protein
MLLGLGGNARPGSLERSCAAVRSTTLLTTRAVPIATGINPTTVTTTWASVWCCVLPMFFNPFFWPRRQAGWRFGAPAPPTFRHCRLKREGAFPCRGEGRRTAPDRSGPRARPGATGAGHTAGHCPRRAHSETGARPGRRWPACPAPHTPWAAQASCVRGSCAARAPVTRRPLCHAVWGPLRRQRVSA